MLYIDDAEKILVKNAKKMIQSFIQYIRSGDVSILLLLIRWFLGRKNEDSVCCAKETDIHHVAHINKCDVQEVSPPHIQSVGIMKNSIAYRDGVKPSLAVANCSCRALFMSMNDCKDG